MRSWGSAGCGCCGRSRPRRQHADEHGGEEPGPDSGFLGLKGLGLGVLGLKDFDLILGF